MNDVYMIMAALWFLFAGYKGFKEGRGNPAYHTALIIGHIWIAIMLGGAG